MKILHNSVVCFSLTQITPMLHFQGGEFGAGIRASDLKPKFDAFLTRYWKIITFDEGVDIPIASYALRRNDGSCSDDMSKHIAFDYKLSVFNDERIDISCCDTKKIISSSSYFGKLRKLSFHSVVKIQFVTHHGLLRKLIQDFFPIFLSVNSFGLRNNKGFGYFKLCSRTEEELKKDILEYVELENKTKFNSNSEGGIGVYQLMLKYRPSEDKFKQIQRLLSSIKIFHQILKSGYNHKSGNDKEYVPSLMLKEMDVADGVILEKKAMKEFMSGAHSCRDNALESRKEVSRYYVRGLLGLAPFYRFTKQKSSLFEDTFRVAIKRKQEQRGVVQRFASPIKYLPLSSSMVVMLINYDAINLFRKNSDTAEFYSREMKKTITMLVPSEEQYSIHSLFKKNGVIQRKFEERLWPGQIKALKDIIGYDVVLDIKSHEG